MTHPSMWKKTSVPGREETGPLFSVDVGAFLQHNSGNRKTRFVAATGVSTARGEQISQCEIRSRSGRRLRQVNGGSRDICHQTYCLAVTAGREKYHKRRRKTNPSSPTCAERCSATTQYCFIIFPGVGFVAVQR